MNAISATDAALPAGATFSTPFLAYCQQTGLSFDWFYFGTGARTWSEDRA